LVEVGRMATLKELKYIRVAEEETEIRQNVVF